jgi:uncharacterized protein (DUF362 family)/NAD-dependent dihydropyrimidine dehydrogenase PreA subunit
MNSYSDGQNRDHRVAVMKCESYAQVQSALSHGLDLLGGLSEFCEPNQRILLKPNLLLGDKPEKGTATHPEFFKAVSKILKSGGAKLSYGDSPGVGSPEMAVRTSGLGDVADSLGMTLADFIHTHEVVNPDGNLIKQFWLAEGLSGMDGIINLPKIKTHGLMRLTGAVKNLFGCLPGVQKATFHARLKDEFLFAEMLVDLAELISPRLHIMDGVLGMEGNGPRNGRMRPIGLVMLSTNPHALDHCVARIMNLDPSLVSTLQVAQERGLYQPEDIEILGEALAPFVIEDYDVNRSKASTTGQQKFYMDLFRDWVTPKPVIDPQACTMCGRCVSVCPASPKAVRFLNGRQQAPQYEYKHCIRCYCCQETCPDEAINIRTPLLGRLLDKVKL